MMKGDESRMGGMGKKRNGNRKRLGQNKILKLSKFCQQDTN